MIFGKNFAQKGDFSIFGEGRGGSLTFWLRVGGVSQKIKRTTPRTSLLPTIADLPHSYDSWLKKYFPKQRPLVIIILLRLTIEFLRIATAHKSYYGICQICPRVCSFYFLRDPPYPQPKSERPPPPTLTENRKVPFLSKIFPKNHFLLHVY